jgi:hypothetical protein
MELYFRKMGKNHILSTHNITIKGSKEVVWSLEGLGG